MHDDMDNRRFRVRDKIAYATPIITLTSKVYRDGTFPDYTRVISPQRQQHVKLEVDASDFLHRAVTVLRP